MRSRCELQYERNFLSIFVAQGFKKARGSFNHRNPHIFALLRDRRSDLSMRCFNEFDAGQWGLSLDLVPVEERDSYMEVLEAASVRKDIVPFTNFLADVMESA